MADENRFRLVELAPKWRERAHVINALEGHLEDALKSVGQANEEKEMLDLFLIISAYLNEVDQEKLVHRFAKFKKTASLPALATKKTSKTLPYPFNGCTPDDPDCCECGPCPDCKIGYMHRVIDDDDGDNVYFKWMCDNSQCDNTEQPEDGDLW
jgi:hypothetical protein